MRYVNVRRLWCFGRWDLTFHDPEAESEYIAFRRPGDGTLWILEIMAWAATVLFLVLWLIQMEAWTAVYRMSNILSCVYLSVFRRLLKRFKGLWRYYDAIAFCWGLHHLLYQSLTNIRALRIIQAFGYAQDSTLSDFHASADEGYQLLWCCTTLTSFSLFASTSMPCYLLLFTAAPGVWIAEVALLGTPLGFTTAMKHFLIYCFLCFLAYRGARQKEISNRRDFLDNCKLSNELACTQTWYLGLQKVLAANFDYSCTIDFDLVVQTPSDLCPAFDATAEGVTTLHALGNGAQEQQRLREFFQQNRDGIRNAPHLFHGPNRITTSLVVNDRAGDFEMEAIWIPGVPRPGTPESEPLGLYWIGLRHSQDPGAVHPQLDVERVQSETGSEEPPPMRSDVNILSSFAESLQEPVHAGLSHGGSEVNDQGNEDGRSLARSVATTTATGRLFTAFHRLKWSDSGCIRDAKLQQQIQKLVEIGARENWLICTEDLDMAFATILGYGGFGMVVAATLHGSEVAVKLPKEVAADGVCSIDILVTTADELRVLRKVRHPNIAMFIGACIDSTSCELCLVSEFVKSTPLGLFVNPQPMTPDLQVRRKMALDIASALQYLHAQHPKIIHGDLKPDNVMVEQYTSNPHAKLIDFGLARLQTKHSRKLGGTARWMAPEVHGNQASPDTMAPNVRGSVGSPGTSADVYSFGLLVYFIVTGLKPGDGLLGSQLRRLDTSQLYTTLCRWPLGISLLEEGRFLCEECLKLDSTARPRMEVIRRRLSTWLLSTAGCDSGQDATARSVEWAEQVRRLRDQIPKNQKRRSEIDRSLSGARAVSPHGTAQQSLLYPSFRPTPATTQEMSLMMLAVRFNISLETSCCCSLHAITSNLLQLTKNLADRCCVPSATPLNRQCKVCGLLEVQQSGSSYWCDFCEDRSVSSSYRKRSKITL